MVSSTHLKPNEKGTLIVVVNTTGFRGMIQKTVEVLSNDPQMPKVILLLKAVVR
ncbi:MAG: hypothetical protein HY805_04990 [Nitrospirae bacterium]|nr:hypothetical protein [Nitrospirota bacterium]